jgi:outer membrane protein assembly factor BamB
MFTKKKEILLKKVPDYKQITLFVASNGSFCWMGENVLFYYQNEKVNVIDFIHVSTLFKAGTDYIFIKSFDKQPEQKLINVNTWEITNLNQFNNIEFFSGADNLLIGVDLLNKTTTAFELKEFTILWQKKGIHNFRWFKDYPFAASTEELAFYNKNNGDQVWEVNDFSQFNYSVKMFIDEPPEERKAEILRIIGVYNSIVWVTLNSGRILGFSITNGELIYNISKPNFFPSDFDMKKHGGNRFYGIYTQLDEENGMLIGLIRDLYWEIDLKAPDKTFVLHSFSKSISKVGFQAMGAFNFPFTKDEIFFGSQYPDNTQIGVFDRRKKEIIWTTSIEENMERKNFDIRQMDYADNKLYVLLETGNLHIYERKV